MLAVLVAMLLAPMAVAAQDDAAPTGESPVVVDVELTALPVDEGISPDEETPSEDAEKTVIRELVMPLMREVLLPIVERVVLPVVGVALAIVIGFTAITGISIDRLSKSYPVVGKGVEIGGAVAANLARLTPSTADDDEIAKQLEKLGYSVERADNGVMRVVARGG